MKAIEIGTKLDKDDFVRMVDVFQTSGLEAMLNSFELSARDKVDMVKLSMFLFEFESVWIDWEDQDDAHLYNLFKEIDERLAEMAGCSSCTSEEENEFLYE